MLTAFTMYAQRFFRPIQDLSEKFNILQSAMAASERIFKLLDEPITIESNPNAEKLVSPRGEIEFRNVWFSYKDVAETSDEDWVLRDVSFRISPGQTFAIVGHTGAGKTTLISLLFALLRYSARANPAGRSRYSTARSAGTAAAIRNCVAGSVPVLRERSRATCAWALRESPARRGACVGRSWPWRLRTNLAPRRRLRSERARFHSFRGSAATDQFRASAGAQSSLPDSGRSHIQRGHENRIADSRSAGPLVVRPNSPGDRAPPQHHSTRRPDSGVP